jgi:outer membrane receptor protein involved in Fe transport
LKHFIHRSGPALLIVLMLIGVAPGLAETAAAPATAGMDESTEPVEGNEANVPAPASVANEVVVVEGSLPYIPTANMIATRLPIELRWTPTNVGTVNEPVLNEQLARVLGEALQNISGVNSQTQSGVADFFTVRGFDSLSGALVLTDGAPEPEVSVYQMYNVERVEVLKGPGGFLYGRNGLSGALAGIVNIVRRQPEPVSFGNVGASYGSFNTAQIDLDANMAPENGDVFSSRLNAMYRESDFYRDDKQNETVAVNPAFAWRLGPDTTLNLNLEYADLKYSPDSGIPLLNNTLPNVDRKTSYQSPVDFSDQTVGRFQFDVQTALNSSWSLRNKIFYRNLDWRTDGTIFTGYANALNPICQPTPGATGPEVCRALTRLDDEQTFAGNQFEVVWDGEGGGVGYNLLMGLELASYADQFTLDVAAIPSISLFNPMETPGPVFPIAPQQVGDSRSLVAAPYVINNFDFTDRFKMLVGARFDFIDFKDTATSESRSDSDISPMLGVTFGASEVVNIYASASEAFAPPSGRVAGEPVPEESRQFEIGTKLGRDGGKVQTTVAFYQLERTNIGIVDATGFTQQAGDQRSRGAEIEFAAQPRPRLRTFVSYAYNDAELTRFTECVGGAVDPATGQCSFGTVDRSGNTPAFAPEHLVNAWVSQRFGNGWGVGGGVRYVSSQFIAEDNQATIDAYLLVDGALYYTLDKWELSLNFRNITVEKYEIRGFGSGSVIPADPISVFAGVDYRF